MLPLFRDIASFLQRRATPPLDHPNFSDADVVAPRSEEPKLIIRVINFELVQPIYAHGSYGTSTLQTDQYRAMHYVAR